MSPKLSNQLLAGVNYFRQIFSDFNTNFNLTSYGLNLYNGFDLAGAPNIQITGFDRRWTDAARKAAKTSPVT